MIAVFRGKKMVSPTYSDADFDDLAGTLSSDEEIRSVETTYCPNCGYPEVEPFPIQCIDGKARFAKCNCMADAYEEDGSLWKPKLFKPDPANLNGGRPRKGK